jgi:hypothetical protein
MRSVTLSERDIESIRRGIPEFLELSVREIQRSLEG